MKRGSIRLGGGLSVAALSTAFASSCSSPPRTPSASSPLSAYAAPSTQPIERIAQMEFGRRAAFAQCVSPPCPAVTPKTLAMEPPTGPPTLSSSNPGSSLAAGAAFVTSGRAPSPLTAPVETPSSAATAAKSTRQVIVHFGIGDASLTATARAQIDEVSSSMPSANRIAISAHTDGVGSPQSNQTLAVARANAVRDHLRARYPHLAAAVTLDAHGACCFVAPNDAPQSRALNRRVEIVFERNAEAL